MAFSYIAERGATSGTIQTFVGPLTASVQILGDNERRVGAILHNGLDREVYVAYHTRASSAGQYTLKLASGSFFETSRPYAGPMAIVCTSASLTGSFQVTEFV